MKKYKNKKVNVRKQLKVRLENTQTRHKNIVGFRPTEQQAYHWFKVMNNGLFNNRLPMVPLLVGMTEQVAAGRATIIRKLLRTVGSLQRSIKRMTWLMTWVQVER